MGRKFLLSVLTVFVFLVMMQVPRVQAEEQEYVSDAWKYKIVSEEDKTIEITGLVKTPVLSEVTGVYTQEGTPVVELQIPGTIDGYKVTGVSCLKKDNQIITNLYRVILPETIVSLGDKCFNGYKYLADIRLPDSLIQIGEYCFAGCSNLEMMLIPKSVSYIGSYAFSKCTKLTAITLPDNISTLQPYTFAGCSALGSIDLPDSLVSLGEGVFYGCCAMDAVVLHDKLTEIGKGAFYKCTALTQLALPQSLTTIRTMAFYGCEKLGAVELPAAIRILEDTAFDPRYSLQLSIPEGVSDFSNISFKGEIQAGVCDYYPNMVLKVVSESPAAVYIQNNDIKITAIYVEKPGVQTEEPNNEPQPEADTKTQTTVTYKIGKTYKKGSYKYTITGKNTASFAGCVKNTITKLSIPSTVSFGGKKYKVTAVSKRACKNYRKLKTVTIGSNVKTIGDEAFMNCTALTSITFGKQVSKIGKKVLYGNKNLKKIQINSKVIKSIGKNTFTKVNKKVKIYVPKGKAKAYGALIKRAK
ncbi:MAG: leucine-rich repeat domain-containing protein [Wujia sp.]